MSCIKVSMADAGSDYQASSSDCQASSSNDFAIIEDSQSGRDSDGEDASIPLPKPTRQTVNKLLQEGDISEHQHTTFFKAAKAFSVRAAEYLLKWYPLEDELLSNAT